MHKMQRLRRNGRTLPTALQGVQRRKDKDEKKTKRENEGYRTSAREQQKRGSSGGVRLRNQKAKMDKRGRKDGEHAKGKGTREKQARRRRRGRNEWGQRKRKR
ncbi:hypothetical protein M378DRAFT_179620 [Amanita muscaria Koide BX008]|uniref:Uncharacterized protein n=1 Tax=Amanita muscaria (strain Koide BX008) TaxID=946122 RepID=A0A0C2SHM0_AMAMK|nr:hypothetical protein M378DRAFT_179620 [Amanita muscaria Koide BX008]